MDANLIVLRQVLIQQKPEIVNGHQHISSDIYTDGQFNNSPQQVILLYNKFRYDKSLHDALEEISAIQRLLPKIDEDSRKN